MILWRMTMLAIYMIDMIIIGHFLACIIFIDGLPNNWEHLCKALLRFAARIMRMLLSGEPIVMLAGAFVTLLVIAELSPIWGLPLWLHLFLGVSLW